MTNKEVISELKYKRSRLIKSLSERDYEVYSKAIEALENQKTLQEELEKIKAEIYRHHNITCNLKCATCFLEYNCELRRKIDLLEDLKIIDKHISELKGENK